MDAKYDSMTLGELKTAAQQADRDLKRRNAILSVQRRSIWTDDEYLRLLALADWLDREVARRSSRDE